MLDAKHKHKCPQETCGHIWEHEASASWSAMRFYKEHCCPECGAWQDTKYYEPGGIMAKVVAALCRLFPA